MPTGRTPLDIPVFQNASTVSESFLTGNQVFNVREYGAKGDGVTDDALYANAARIAMEASTEAKKTFYFPTGTYLLGSNFGATQPPASGSVFSLSAAGSVKVKGDGKGKTIIKIASPRAIFELISGTAGTLDITFEDITFIYTGGWNTTGFSVGIIGGAHAQSVRIHDCEFIDLTHAYAGGGGATAFLEVTGSGFYYTFGHAGVGMVYPSDPNHPAVAIIGLAVTTVIEDNEFDGLLTPSFSGVPNSPPTSYKVPYDGFVATNATGVDITIRNNKIRNYHVEGLDFTDPTNAGIDPTTCSTTVEDNQFLGGPVPSDSSYYFTGFQGAITMRRGGRASITGNKIKHNHSKVYAAIHVSAGGNDVPGGVHVDKNIIEDSSWGILVTGTTDATVTGNTITGPLSYPASEIALGLFNTRSAIHVTNIATTGTVIQGNTIDGGAQTEWWAASATVDATSASNSRVMIPSASVAAFTVGAWVELRKVDTTHAAHLLIAPIDAKGANYLDLSAGWAAVGAGFGTNTAIGDTVAQYSIAGRDPTDRGGILLGSSSTAVGSGTRIVHNTIRHVDMGVKNIGTITNSTTDGNIYGSTVAIRETNATKYFDPASLSAVQTFSGENTFSGATTTYTNAAYIAQVFVDSGAGANLKKMVDVWDDGLYEKRLLNDDDTLKSTPLKINSTRIQTAIPLNVGATSGVDITRIRHGTAVLVAGVKATSDATITASTHVLLTRKTDGGTIGCSYSVTRTASTSFTITSKDSAGATQTSDTSTLSYMLIEP